MRKLDWILAAVALLFSATLSFASSAASVSIERSASTDEQSATADHLQTFAGVVVSMNGARFILRDDDNNVWYHLDDQQTAGKLVGKRVEVTGQLDTMTDMIHIRTIVEAK